MKYYLIFNAAGECTGNGVTPDGTMPAGAVQCTLAQYSSAADWALSNGALVAYTPPAPAPTLAQQAATLYTAAIAQGLNVTSTGTPALNGIYGVSSTPDATGSSQTSNISDEAQFIGNFSEFTNGTTTALEWPLANGENVEFVSTAQFMTFAKAAAQYVAACKVAATAVANGITASWPSNAATIP